MSKLFIANSTRQEIEINVRIPETSKIFTRKISSGRQAEVEDLSAAQLEAVVRHLTKYGAVLRSNVRGKVKDFDGIIYSLDKPINENEYHYGNEEVADKAQSRSVTEAFNSALAAERANRKGGKRIGKKVEVEFVEEGKPLKGSKPLKMNVVIDESTNGATPLQMQ